MKKILIVLGLISAVSALEAQQLDVAVAQVKLTRMEIITQTQFNTVVNQVEQETRQTLTSDQKRKVLEDMMAEKLIIQAAERSGAKATDQEIISMAKAQFGQPQATDADLRKALEAQGVVWNEFLTTSRTQLVVRKYLNTMPKAQEINKIGVTDQEINEYFAENKSKLMNPDMIRVSHIFFDTKSNPRVTPAVARKKAEDTAKAIAAGTLTFEEAARTLSEDASTALRAGDLGFIRQGQDGRFLPTATTKVPMTLGTTVVANLFKMKKGENSGAVESANGFHIFRISDKIDQQFLGLEDKPNPLEAGTVKDLLKAQLTLRNRQKAQEALQLEILGTLKAEAGVVFKIIPEKL